MHVKKYFRYILTLALGFTLQNGYAQNIIIQPDTTSKHLTDITEISDVAFTLPATYIDFVIELIDDFPRHYEASLGNFNLSQVQEFNELLEPESIFHLTLLDYLILNMNPNLIEQINQKFPNSQSIVKSHMLSTLPKALILRFSEEDIQLTDKKKVEDDILRLMDFAGWSQVFAPSNVKLKNALIKTSINRDFAEVIGRISKYGKINFYNQLESQPPKNDKVEFTSTPYQSMIENCSTSVINFFVQSKEFIPDYVNSDQENILHELFWLCPDLKSIQTIVSIFPKMLEQKNVFNETPFDKFFYNPIFEKPSNLERIYSIFDYMIQMGLKLESNVSEEPVVFKLILASMKDESPFSFVTRQNVISHYDLDPNGKNIQGVPLGNYMLTKRFGIPHTYTPAEINYSLYETTNLIFSFMTYYHVNAMSQDSSGNNVLHVLFTYPCAVDDTGGSSASYYRQLMESFLNDKSIPRGAYLQKNLQGHTPLTLLKNNPTYANEIAWIATMLLARDIGF